MGEQVGNQVGGSLAYIPATEFDRILQLDASVTEKAAIFADCCRLNVLYMIAKAGSGHIGSSFSSMDLVVWLHLHVLSGNIASGEFVPDKLFFSSKGHDAPCVYSVWIALGRLNFALLHQLRRLGGLPGHPDVATPNVVTNTGSLGMGVSKAKGLIFANRLRGVRREVFVLVGDGELQEGQFWESLISASNDNLDELTVIIDHNKLQSDTLVSIVSDLGDLESKLVSFGWQVDRCDGNDMAVLDAVFKNNNKIKNKPKIIIADTVKGKGVSFMEHTAIDSDVELYKFHSGAPSESQYDRAFSELYKSVNVRLESLGQQVLSFESSIENVNAKVPLVEKPQKLIEAYSQALVDQASYNDGIVALDADLALDTGLLPFKKRFPKRFLECGIAEQDMVSQAGGIALAGLLPIAHSFACFLTSRPQEQIYNNCTEMRKVIYVGSLAGVLPAGPGHSHQAVRDISSMAAMPKMILAEPSSEAEVFMLLDWAVKEWQYSSYIRLVSLPWRINFKLPDDYKLQLGAGVVLREGDEVAVFAAGPILLTAAMDAALELDQNFNIKCKVINMPWLNFVDHRWIVSTLSGVKHCFCIDNHYQIGGQGDRIADAIQLSGVNFTTVTKIAIDQVPVCGQQEEVLSYHGLSSSHIAQQILCKLNYLEQ